jgi:hypothetical protein
MGSWEIRIESLWALGEGAKGVCRISAQGCALGFRGAVVQRCVRVLFRVRRADDQGV